MWTTVPAAVSLPPASNSPQQSWLSHVLVLGAAPVVVFLPPLEFNLHEAMRGGVSSVWFADTPSTWTVLGVSLVTLSS